MKRTNHRKSQKPKTESYLEVYIREDASIIFTTLTGASLALIKEISGKKVLSSVWCG